MEKILALLLLIDHGAKLRLQFPEIWEVAIVVAVVVAIIRHR